jgi:hypothetical protein
MLLYVIFASGLLPNGGPFPAFEWNQVELTTHKYRVFLNEFMDGGSPKEFSDVGKVLVWSFVAGFAERLVPDILGRLARTAEEKSSA